MIIDSCLIVKNESKNIANVIENLIKFSRYVYIVDTGSDDNTCEIVKSYSDRGVFLDHFDWIFDFGEARNYSFSLSKDSDYKFWCDGDEQLSEAFVNKLIEFSKLSYDERLPDGYAYLMTTKSETAETCEYWRIGLVKNSPKIFFEGKIHEYINTYDKNIDYEMLNFKCLINPYDKSGAEIYRNFDIFSRISKERPLTCRELFYIGRELNDVGCPIAAQMMYVEAVYHPMITTEAIDGLYNYLINYINYESCRSIKSASVEQIINHVIDIGFFNKYIFYLFAKVCFDHLQNYELALRCIDISFEHDDMYEQIITTNGYDIKLALFLKVLILDKIGLHKYANAVNDKILSIDSQNESALYNKEYFKNLFKNGN